MVGEETPRLRRVATTVEEPWTSRVDRGYRLPGSRPHTDAISTRSIVVTLVVALVFVVAFGIEIARPIVLVSR